MDEKIHSSEMTNFGPRGISLLGLNGGYRVKVRSDTPDPTLSPLCPGGSWKSFVKWTRRCPSPDINIHIFKESFI